MLAGAMFLTCAVTSPSVTQATIVHNIRLPQDVAEQMASSATPVPAVRFTDQTTAETGWVLTYGLDQGADVIGVSRIARHGDAERPFAVRSGKAIRAGAGGAYAFTETMRGSCRLAREDELK